MTDENDIEIPCKNKTHCFGIVVDHTDVVNSDRMTLERCRYCSVIKGIFYNDEDKQMHHTYFRNYAYLLECITKAKGDI